MKWVDMLEIDPVGNRLIIDDALRLGKEAGEALSKLKLLRTLPGVLGTARAP